MTALETILAFPTVIYTILLGISTLYWMMVIFGALDMDGVSSAAGKADGALGSLGGKADGALGALGGKAEGALGALGGKAEGALGALGGKAEGALGALGGKAEGALGALGGKAEGALGALGGKAEGALGALGGKADGAVEALGGKADGVADGALEGASGKADGVFSLVSALNLRKAPLTVTLSVFSLTGWGACALTMQAIAPWLASMSLPMWLAGIPVLILSAIVALLITSQAVRPLGKLFVTHRARGRSDLVGKMCVVSTGSVDERFGQAMYDDKAAGIILQIRARPGQLKRGDKALIIGWDEALGGFVVEPMNEMMEVRAPDSVRARFEALEDAAAKEHAATEELLSEKEAESLKERASRT